MYLVIKNRLTYYEGTSASGHYISGSAYADNGSFDADYIGLKDCHYDDRYAGWHLEPFNNVFEALYYYYESRGVSNILW